MSDEDIGYNDPLDYIDEKYQISSGDNGGFVEYDPDGAEEVEFVYKMEIAAIHMSENDIDVNYDLEILTLSRIYGDIWDEADQRETLREKMRGGMELYQKKGTKP